MKVNISVFRIIIVSVAAALVSGVAVYLFRECEIKKWKDVAITLQEQFANLEYQINQYVEGSALGFVQIAENRFLGEAVVSGNYHINGDGSMCFKPDKESIPVLPKNDAVQAFCFKAATKEDKENLVREFFGVDLATALADLPKYAYVDPARKATIQIRGYEIKTFNKNSQTGYTNLLQIIRPFVK